MFVGVARLTLQVPEASSLKAKRQVVRRITDRVKARFNVSVAEVGEPDVWQRAIIGVSVVGNARAHVDAQLSKVIQFVEDSYVAPVIEREQEISSFGDDLFGEDPEGAEALSLAIPKGTRSLAEVEGLGTAPPEASPRQARERGDKDPGQGRPLSLDEARVRARQLRNPRDWEKE